MNHTQQLVIKQFSTTFNNKPEAMFYAPGRVNLIGEHTDYNNGFVMPCAIDRGTYMSVGKNHNQIFRVMAYDQNQTLSEWSISDQVQPDDANSWANYLRGVHQEFLKRGFTFTQGYDFCCAGNIPQGAGLSSSASFSVAFATALSELNHFNLTPTDIALICQAAENNFVGCKCGIMDQLISAAGQKQHALLIDCRDLSSRSVKMPEQLSLLIIDSKVKRGLVESEYNLRRQQCEAAARIMGVDSLREADLHRLTEYKNKMSDIEFRRAHHVITENARTELAAVALSQNDIPLLSRLMAESHQSMRDDFAITIKPIDLLVEIVSNIIGDSGGVRMTGGGFGGCVVSLLPHHLVDTVTQAISDQYTAHTQLIANTYICNAGNGAGRIDS